MPSLLPILIGIPGHKLEPQTQALIERLMPAGFVLFSRNIASAQQIIELVKALRASLPHPSLIAVDEEGGGVSRLHELIGPTPSATQLGRCDPKTVETFARTQGRLLASLGFNLNLAPVLDLGKPGEPGFLGARTFAHESTRLTEAARAYLQGLREAGVLACGKHFPGLGDVDLDPHHSLPQLSSTEAGLAPFRALTDELPCLMVAHVSLDEAGQEPLTLDANRLPPLLQAIDYQGWVLSDDLDMGAITERTQPTQAIERAWEAGCNLPLLCHRPEAIGDLQAPPDLLRDCRQRLQRAPQPAPSLEAFEQARHDLHACVKSCGLDDAAGQNTSGVAENL